MSEKVTPTASTTSTNDVQAILSAAERLSGTLSIRKEQANVLVSYCRELVDQTATQENVQHDFEGGWTSGMDDLKSACESVKGVLDALTQKGFLWCIVNAEKIENQVHTARDCLLGAYQAFQLDEANFLSKLAVAQKKDREDMTQHLLYLSQDDDRLLQAIQDREGVYRRVEEVEVNIIKHVEHIPIRDESTPEDRFLQAVEKMLRSRPDRKSDLKFPDYILSSMDIDHNLHQTIGGGASGQVYLGRWHGTLVAIKRMHPSEAKTISADMRRKIYHEISIWANLRHDNILPLYGACPDADVPFLVMKYCPEGDVRQFLRKNPTEDRFKLSCDVAIGLAFLHSKSIVHADIKGMNVLISGEHRALLTDFGLSIAMNEIRNLSTYSNEMQGKPRGTMAWMAPEVHRGSRPDKSSDIYSLGMTIWEIYSNQTPFSGTRLEVLSGVVKSGTRPERPVLLDDDKVWAVVRRCWANAVKSRPTAGQVVDLLNSSNTDGILSLDFNEVNSGLLAPDSSGEEFWNWNNSMTANNSVGSRTTKSLPWQAEDSSDDADGSSRSTVESALDPKDQIWMDVLQALPPQWEHVPWGGSMYANSVTIPYVPSDKQYTYRVVKGQSDLGTKNTYERNPDGSQTINFLEYNSGYGIIDSTHVKVFATDSQSGREFLAVEWNPRNKPLGNVESRYAKEVRGAGVAWTIAPADADTAENSSRVVSVTLNGVPADTDYDFRVISGDTDLGTRYVGPPRADHTLTINLKEFNHGAGISSESLIKVLVIDRDIKGMGTFVAARWPSDTTRDIQLPHPPELPPAGVVEDTIPDTISLQPISAAPSSQLPAALPPASVLPLMPSRQLTPPSTQALPAAPGLPSAHSLQPNTKRFFCLPIKRSSPRYSEKSTGWWQRFKSRFYSFWCF